MMDLAILGTLVKISVSLRVNTRRVHSVSCCPNKTFDFIYICDIHLHEEALYTVE